jgi:adenine-specific DNA-methyltransferase
VHYTPSALALFVARRVLAQAERRELSILDPACGDGELLLAITQQAADEGLPAPRLVGIDRDPDALAKAAERLSVTAAANHTLQCGDFLAANIGAGTPLDRYDVVISNPPYVRTQILGATRAQALGRRYGLTGRIDLYHAFVAGMTEKLVDGGLLGLICSNRFMTTKGGQSLRSMFVERYSIAELWDLGDTKLFSAAVLPAVVIARYGNELTEPPRPAFVRVYEDASPDRASTDTSSLVNALADGSEGSVKVDGRVFTIERGELADSTADRPWRMTCQSSSRWLAQVKKRSAGRFGDLGPIRVGIKTTADSVFIRETWDDLPSEATPESALLHPLITHRVASRWLARATGPNGRLVLYPHEIHEGRRRPVDLTRFPRAARYLEQHRARLEGREYVRKAKRAWYEIWVPQQPDAWAAPKLVWPDISERPRFFLDYSKAIVNGDCYWLSCEDRPEEEVMLALAVANSSFAVQHYDTCYGNRLYAGRRRFITQYLQELPIPEASATELGEVSQMVSDLRQPGPDTGSQRYAALEATLDEAIAELFGLKEVPR